MNHLIIRTILVLVTLFASALFSQTSEIDSLKKILRTARTDSLIAESLTELSFVFLDNKNYDSALVYADNAMKAAERTNNTKMVARVYSAYGKIAFKKGDLDKSIDYNKKAIGLLEKHSPTTLLAMIYGNQGNSYYRRGYFPQSLENYLKAIKIYEQFGDKVMLAGYSGNIGMIYQSMSEPQKAIEFYSKALRANTELNIRQSIAINLVCIGNAKIDLDKYSEALDYFFKGLKINEQIGNKGYISNNLGNIAVVYLKMKEYQKAYEFGKQAELSLGSNEQSHMITNNLNLGDACIALKRYKEAEFYLLKNVELFKNIRSLDQMNQNCQKLSTLYAALGDNKKALDYLRMHITLKDSLFNDENNKKIIQQQTQFEFDKKAAADSIRVSEEKKLLGLQLKQEKTQRYSLYAGLALLLVFAGFMYNRFKITQKQKRIIELKEKETQFQKGLVEEKQKEIVDSINYAKRIQYSLLASDKLLTENLKNHFLYFKPKDIVSGDFYWGAPLSNGNFALLTADSTGHGVPGAIMSMLNISCINEAINSEKLVEPAQILTSTRTKIINHLSNDGSQEGGKDGMDCSLLVFDFKNKKLSYAAANNPVWIVRGKDFISLPADRMPIGRHTNDATPFKQNEFELQANDMVYTLTDGYPDQFGGPKGKKFKYKQLEEMLLSISSQSLSSQKDSLHAKFEEWKGDLEQVDDVTIIGIRV